MSGSRTFEIVIRGDARQVEQALAAAGATAERTSRRIQSGMGNAGTSLRELGDSGATAERMLGGLASRLGPVGAGLSAMGAVGTGVAATLAAVALGAAAVARAGEEMVVSLNRLKSATGSVEAARDVYERLYRVSLQTGVSVSESVDAFSRFAIAGRAIGATNEQVVELVATIQSAGKLAGASAQEVGAASMQLAQALASGVLQGDELRSLLEQMPQLAERLAGELGVSIGELRRMGSEGRLTADRVFPALLRAGEDLRKELGQMAPTMADGFATLRTATQRFLGDLDEALGLSRRIGAALQGAGEALDGARRRFVPTATEQLEQIEAEARARIATLQAQLTQLDQRAPSARRGSIQPALQATAREASGGAAVREAELRAEVARQLAIIEDAQIQRIAIESEGDLRSFNEQMQGQARAQAARRADLTTRVEALRQQLDQVAKAEADHAKRMETLRGALAGGAIDQARYNRLVAQSEEALAKAREGAARAAADPAAERAAEKRRDVLATVERELDAAERERDAALLSAQARRELAVQMDIERRIREAGIPAVERRTEAEREAAETIERQVRATQSMREETARATEARQQATQAAERATQEASGRAEESVREMARTSERIAEDASEAIFDSLTDRGRAQSVMDWFRTLFKRIAVQALSANVLLPITTQVVGLAPSVFGASGAAAGAGTAGGGMSGLGSLSNLYSLGSNAYSMYTGAGATGMAAGINSLGVSSGLFGNGVTFSAGSGAASYGGFGVAGEGAVSGVFGSGTASAALGGIGLGFAGGSMLGGYLAGDSEARQTNAQIGAGAGSLAGFAIGTMLGGPVLGAILGGLMGGGAGGLIGPGPKTNAYGFGVGAEDGRFTLDGYLSRTGNGNGGAEAYAAASQTFAAVNALIAAAGVSVSGASTIAAGGDVDPSHRGSAGAALQDFRFTAANDSRLDAVLQGRTFDSVEALAGIIQEVQQLGAVVDAINDPVSAFQQQVDTLHASFDASIQSAQRLGFGEAELTAERDRQVAALIAQRDTQVAVSRAEIAENLLRAQGRSAQADAAQAQREANVAIEAYRDNLKALGLTVAEAAPHVAALTEQLVAQQRATAAATQEAQRRAIADLDTGSRRAIAAASGHVADGRAADLFAFDESTRRRLAEAEAELKSLGFTAEAIAPRLAQLQDQLRLEREALEASYRAREDAARQALDDRVFAATSDNSTLAGALAALERQQARERLEAARTGLVSLTELQVVHAVETAKVMQDFAAQAQAAATQTRDAMRGLGGGIREYLDRLAGTPAGGLSPAAQLQAAQAAFQRDLTLAQGGDQAALGRITNSADALLAAQQAWSGSGGQTAAMREWVTSQLGMLPAVRDYDAEMLAALQALPGNISATLDLKGRILELYEPAILQRVDPAIRQIIESLRPLSEAELRQMVSAGTIRQAVEQVLGRPLTAAELARLKGAGTLRQMVEQLLGRALTPAEVARLENAGTLRQVVEQMLGRTLTPAEAARLEAPGSVRQVVEQILGRGLTAVELARLETGGTLRQVVEQLLGRTLTAAEAARLEAPGTVRQAVEQIMGRALTAAELAQLEGPGPVRQTVEQLLGRALTAAELAKLEDAGTLRQVVEQILGRTLTEAEAGRLRGSGNVRQTVEQFLGRLLTADEFAKLSKPRNINQIVQQFLGRPLTAAEMAKLEDAGSIRQTVEQILGRTLTAAETARLEDAGALRQTVEQILGRTLTEAEAAKLRASGNVRQTVEQFLGRVLTEAEFAQLSKPRNINQIVQQFLGRPLTAAEVARLEGAATLRQVVEQMLGRTLTAAELAKLEDAGTLRQVVEQILGRALTAADLARLQQPGTVQQLVEQMLGRALTPAEKAALVSAGAVPRTITQQILGPTGAELLTAANIARTIQLGFDYAVTNQFSYLHNLADIRTFLFHLREAARGAGGGLRVTTLQASGTLNGAFADGGGVLANSPGWGGNYGGLVANAMGNAMARARVIPFARGGLPEMVSAPTFAPMAMFGEAGPEAIMPLRRGRDGRLGVAMQGGDGARSLAQLQHMTAVLQAGFKTLLQGFGGLQQEMADLRRRLDPDRAA
ncbi:tape measure protein [Roseomonas frigidaquae]|uniref:Tape measure protein n=1 Tax=Falsiroseomonas frigidaquae TaxID=487318 RepID=A0ABX1ES60_9PROT|nr:tape measure protein [Falsiroseomonas frigidaquae]NKE43378.1 tape measure protein [Falsiroseomonas frigidaquae]